MNKIIPFKKQQTSDILLRKDPITCGCGLETTDSFFFPKPCNGNIDDIIQHNNPFAEYFNSIPKIEANILRMLVLCNLMNEEDCNHCKGKELCLQISGNILNASNEDWEGFKKKHGKEL